MDNSGNPKPTTTREWAPLMVGVQTIGLVCPLCGEVMPPSDEGDPQAAHDVRCAARNA